METVEVNPKLNYYSTSFINDLITDDDFDNIILLSIKLKADISDIAELNDDTLSDNEIEEQAKKIITTENRKILHKAKRFVVTDEGYFDLMKEKIKFVFGNILERIIDIK